MAPRYDGPVENGGLQFDDNPAYSDSPSTQSDTQNQGHPMLDEVRWSNPGQGPANGSMSWFDNFPVVPPAAEDRHPNELEGVNQFHESLYTIPPIGSSYYLTVGANDGPSQTLLSNSREELMPYLLEGARSTGPQQECVASYSTPHIPNGAFIRGNGPCEIPFRGQDVQNTDYFSGYPSGHISQPDANTFSNGDSLMSLNIAMHNVQPPPHYSPLPQTPLGNLAPFPEPWSTECPRADMLSTMNLPRQGVVAIDGTSSKQAGSRKGSSMSNEWEVETPNTSQPRSSMELGLSNSTLRPASKSRGHPSSEHGLLPNSPRTPLQWVSRTNPSDQSPISEQHWLFHGNLPQDRRSPCTSDGSAHSMRSMDNNNGHLNVHQPPCSIRPSPPHSIVSATSSTPNCLPCNTNQCGAQFTGIHRKGNRARHLRLKHGASERIYHCEASNCRKEFKRQDARVKHYRKHHVELSRGPASSRKTLPQEE